MFKSECKVLFVYSMKTWSVCLVWFSVQIIAYSFSLPNVANKFCKGEVYVQAWSFNLTEKIAARFPDN